MHQSLHHFVADSNWSDRALLDGAWAWVSSRFPKNCELYWAVDDTGMPKKGKWLLIEWPDDKEAPTKYWFSTLSKRSSLKKLVCTAKMRWRIERDYQELKDELGLNHYEGRNWRGFHHHATLCIVSHAFLDGQQLAHPNRKKSPHNAKNLPYPKITSHGVPQRAQRHVEDSISTIKWYVAQALGQTLGYCPCCGDRRDKPRGRRAA